jgi:hypothetical protein
LTVAPPAVPEFCPFDCPKGMVLGGGMRIFSKWGVVWEFLSK